MKKNLKKVISAVLALTLALSSFVALNVSAATFADVADTASYAEAVNALSALGAISGYEDGTFLPNNNITRAEVTTMVVAALNLTADAKNSGSTTQFADVNANAAWAAGYVNVGVAQGFISGMSATEFAPSENVTYAQVLSMLTRILGYGEFAEARGGWPNGYLTAASTAGILSGVSAGANDAVTRAQVAQLIWNAVQAPILDITTFSTSSTGSEMQKMDGKNGRSFKTVLSDKFDAYVLNVIVKANSKGESGTAGEIEMELTSTNDWNPEEEALVAKGDKAKAVKVGNTAAEDYLFSSAKVVAEYNDDDEWTLLYFAPTAKVTTKTVDGTLVADQVGNVDKDGVTADYIRIKKSASSSTTTNYKLNDAALYINGVSVGDVADNIDLTHAMLSDSVGEVTLFEDADKSGYYDVVMVDYYITARVNQVSPKADSTKVTLSSVTYNKEITNPKTTFEIQNDDLESGDKVVSVTKAGAAADLSALAKDDIVAIKYDVTKTLDESKFFNVLATTDTVTGKYTSYDDEEETYAVGGNAYEAVAELGLEIGVTYTFNMDPFGRLFDYSEEADSKNFAIVERYVDIDEVTSSSSEFSYIQVMTLNGQSKTLYIDSNYDDDARTIMGDMDIRSTVSATAKNVAIKDRVIEYTVKTSTGRVNSISAADTLEFYGAEYSESSNRLSKTLSATAAVIDATSYDTKAAKTSDYKLSSLSALTDNVEYDGVLVYRNSDSEYCYVIITSAGSVYGDSSDFVVAAVDASLNSQGTYNDEECYTLYVMQNGNDSAEVLNISKSVDVYVGYDAETGLPVEGSLTDIDQGAVFFYGTDSDGLVDEISVVFKGAADFETVRDLDDMEDLLVLPSGSDVVESTDDEGNPVVKNGTITPEDWMITLDEKAISGDTAIQLLIAPVVVAKSTSSISVASVGKDTAKDSDGKSGTFYYANYEDQYNFSIASDANIYAYDMSGDVTGKNALSNGSFMGVNSKDADSDGRVWFGAYEVETTSGTETVTDMSDSIQVALLMVVDGVVTNALVMTN